MSFLAYQKIIPLYLRGHGIEKAESTQIEYINAAFYDPLMVWS